MTKSQIRYREFIATACKHIREYAEQYKCSLAESVDDYEYYPNGVSTGLTGQEIADVNAELGLASN